MAVRGYARGRFGHSMASDRAGLFPTPRLHTDIDFLKADLADRPSAAPGLSCGLPAAFFLQGGNRL